MQAALSARSAFPTSGAGTPRRASTAPGLVAWAYAQVGISLPHFSGAQYDDTTHIPLADIEPGDLLFYGPGGSEHVAMYVGGGSMIEAPYTGASVWITGVRTGDGSPASVESSDHSLTLAPRYSAPLSVGRAR